MAAEDRDPAPPAGGRVERLAANLWRWRTPHPAWSPGDDRPGADASA